MATPEGFPEKYTNLWGHTPVSDVVDADTVLPAGITADSPLEEAIQYALENTGGVGSTVTSGAGAPATTPAAVGDVYVDTAAGNVYLAATTVDASGWKQATGAGGGDLLAANNLSDVASAATALTNLGAEIGVNVQAWSAVLDATTAAFTTADETKLDGVETGATADQTGAEIKAAYEGEANAFTDAQFTKLAGVETGADVTDTANVTAAGAVMDSEVDANIKTLALPASTTISSFGASLVDDAAATNARTTLGLVIGSDVQAHSAVLDATTASFTTADETKLDGVETSADVTDETNVVAALDNATLTDVGTPAATDRVLLQDASDTNALKYADFSEFGGGGGGTSYPLTVDCIVSPSGIVPLLGSDYGQSTADGVNDGDTTYYRAFFLNEEVTISDIAVDVYTATATETKKFAIYNNGSDDRPSTLVTNSGGTVATDTVQLVNTALAANITIGPGVYWWATNASTSGLAAFRSFAGGVAYMPNIGFDNIGANLHQDLKNAFKETSQTHATFPKADAAGATLVFVAGNNAIHWVAATLV